MNETPTPPHPALARSRRVAYLLDDLFRIPGTRIRVGLDPILGFVLGAGDLVSWGVGLHLVWTGWRMGAGPATLLRMAGHLALDFTVGAVPGLGDLFDIGYRANDRNLKILESLHRAPEATRRSSVLWLGGILAGSTAVAAGVLWTLGRVVSAVIGLF